MADAATGLADIGKAAGRNYLWASAIVVVLAVVVLACYNRKLAKVAGGTGQPIPVACPWISASTGKPVLPTFALKILGYAVPTATPPATSLLAVGIGLAALLASGAVHAGSCCSVGVPASHAGIWAIVLAIVAAVPFGVVAAAPDAIDAQLENGNKSANVNLDATPVGPSGLPFEFFVQGKAQTNGRGRPLVAIDEVVALSTTVEQQTTGTLPIYDDDLGSMLLSIEEISPKLGTLLDSTTGTGPIVKLLIEFIGLGFNRGADVPVASISVPSSTATDVTLTRYWTIPHAQRFLGNPLLTAPWLPIIDQTKIRPTLSQSSGAGPVGIGNVSAGAIMRGATQLRVSTTYLANDLWHLPMIPYFLLETPVPGSQNVTLRNYGEADPTGTDPTEYEFLLSLLSNLKQLPGNIQISQVQQITATGLKFDKVENIDLLVMARLKAQRLGNTNINGAGGAQGIFDGNYAQGANVDGMTLESLLALHLRQPSVNFDLRHCRKLTAGYQEKLQFVLSGGNPTGPWAFLHGFFRYLNASVTKDVVALSGGKMASNPLVGKPVKKAA